LDRQLGLVVDGEDVDAIPADAGLHRDDYAAAAERRAPVVDRGARIEDAPNELRLRRRADAIEQRFGVRRIFEPRRVRPGPELERDERTALARISQGRGR